MSFVSEFREFAVKGNVMDMAVGVIIGGAFGKIVTSFIADVVMPPLGLFTGGINFSDMAITLQEAKGEAPAVLLKYGSFFQAMFDFTILALCVFMMVKAINNWKKAEPPEPDPEPTAEEGLLTEIRDLLSKK